MEKKSQLDYQATLSAMDINELRHKASKVYGLKISREHKASDLVNLILEELKKGDFMDVADGALKEGWARIKVHQQSGKASMPIYTNTNGYVCWIPPGHEVDVPIKVLETLNHAEEMHKVLNEFNEYVDSFELSYPYQILAVNPGKDPRPGIELQRDKKHAPFVEYYRLFGRWPGQKEMQNYMNNSISFNPFTGKGKIREEANEE